MLPFFTAKSASASYESRGLASQPHLDVLSAAPRKNRRVTEQLRTTCSVASFLPLLAEGNKEVGYATRVSPTPAVVPIIVEAISEG